MGIDAATQTVEPWPEVPAQTTPATPSEKKPPPPPPGGYPFYRAYIHLILPISLCVFNTLTLNLFVLLPTAILTYFIGSFIYPKYRLPPSPESPEARRFSEKWWVYHVAILQLYDFLSSPVPFNVSTLVQNVGISYVTLNYFGLLETEGQGPSRLLWGSAFLKPALRVAASESVMYLLSRYVPVIANNGLVRWLHAALWRAAVVALIDDVIGGLAYPDVRTKKGKAKVVALQIILFLFTVSARETKARGLVTLEQIAAMAGMSVEEMLQSGKTLEELLPSGTPVLDKMAAETVVAAPGKPLQKKVDVEYQEGAGGWFWEPEDLNLFDNDE